MLPDVARVAEAAYRLDRDERPWVLGLADALRPALAGGLGLAACAYDSDRLPFHVRSFVSTGDPAFEAAIRAVPLHGPADGRARVYLRPPNATFGGSSPCGRSPARGRTAPRPAAPTLAGALGLMADDSRGTGVMLAAALPEPRRLEPREMAGWRRVAAHVAAALLLRRLVAQERGPSRRQAAGMKRFAGSAGSGLPDSSCDWLRAAARRTDRARCDAMPTTDDEALRAWHELLAGRWKLVDRFDADGRRFLLARRCASGTAAHPPAGLSPREGRILACAACGHANKWIASILGLSPATISMHLSDVMHKLGLSSRVDLVRLVSALPSGAMPQAEAEAEAG